MKRKSDEPAPRNTAPPRTATEALERARGHARAAAAEAVAVGIRRMSADAHAMLFGQTHGLAHHRGVGSVKAARHIGDRNQRHDAGIVTAFIDSIGFAHIAIEIDGHCRYVLSIREPGRQFRDRDLACQAGLPADPSGMRKTR